MQSQSPSESDCDLRERRERGVLLFPAKEGLQQQLDLLHRLHPPSAQREEREELSTLNKNINTTCKALIPCFMSWNKRSRNVPYSLKADFSQFLCTKFVYIRLSEHFSFAKIIHPSDKCGISRSWLNSMIIIQVHLVLGTITGHSKMCSFVTQNNATNVSRFEGACYWHADYRNVHQSCCQRI
jgi:hypothetical protein